MGVKLRFIKALVKTKKSICKIKTSGEFWFNPEAGRQLGLSTEKSISVAVSVNYPLDSALYLVVNDEFADGAFRVKQSGGYHYIQARALCEELGINYSRPVKFIVSRPFNFIVSVAGGVCSEQTVYRLRRD